jgi:phospholipid/cholesterol/gamma-HCH transport system permease protein
VILTFQASHQLRQFGANVYAVDLVVISMVREFSPMLTGVILAGRSGAAMAAELGTMVVQEELDALRMMGIHPVRYLVLPRLLGLTLTMPALALMSDFIGIGGGYVIAATRLDIPGAVFVTRTLEVVDFQDWTHGIQKSVVFGALIALAGCYHGLAAAKGSAAVGRAATRAVVAGIFLIIVADSAFALVTTLSGA